MIFAVCIVSPFSSVLINHKQHLLLVLPRRVERGEDTGVFSDVWRGTRRAHAPKRLVGREAAARGRRIAKVGERRWR